MTPRLAVIGAGPVGIEAALRGVARGWEVSVFEAGDVGAHLRRWGHVRFFTPSRMNLSALARETLGSRAPDPERILTGAEHVREVLLPLAEGLGVRTRTRVVAVGRRRLGKAERVGHPLRAERPFALLLDNERLRQEEVFVADGVIDASGVFENPLFSGRGGIPAPGERAAHVVRHLPDISADPVRWQQRIVLVGNGHSAANALGALADLRRDAGGGSNMGQVTWVVPDDRSRPADEVAADPLPERRDVVKRANDLGSRPPPWLRVLRRGAVVGFGAGLVRVATRAGVEDVACEEVLSLVGYRPNRALLAECPVALDPAFEGGLALAGALSRVTDCLAKVEVTPADLFSGEPDLFLAGHRSYGSRNTFLLQTGLAHLDAIFEGWKLRRRG